MPLDFPTSPTIGQTYSSGTKTWQWDGAAWVGTTGFGPQGTQGVQGTQGLQGVQGIQGTSLSVNQTFPIGLLLGGM